MSYLTRMGGVLAAGAALSLPVNSTLAATLTGRVATTDGEPVVGAMVTLWNEARNRKETVYSNAAGEYRLDTDFSGLVQLRGRVSMYRDFNTEFQLSPDAVETHNLAMELLTDPREISDSLTASAHAAALPFPDQATRNVFISQCSYCHQQGNSLTRRPRSQEEWSEVAWRMEGYGAWITYGEHRRIVELLGAGFDGTPVTVVQTNTYSPELPRARVEEWHAGNALSFLHDTIVGHDGKLYGIDEGKDMIFILDRDSGEIEEVHLPDSDLPQGGRFAGIRLPIGVFTGQRGPAQRCPAEGRANVHHLLPVGRTADVQARYPRVAKLHPARGLPVAQGPVPAHHSRGPGREPVVHGERIEPGDEVRPRHRGVHRYRPALQRPDALDGGRAGRGGHEGRVLLSRTELPPGPVAP